MSEKKVLYQTASISTVYHTDVEYKYFSDSNFKASELGDVLREILARLEKWEAIIEDKTL